MRACSVIIILARCPKVARRRRNRTPACLHAPWVEATSEHQPDSSPPLSRFALKAHQNPVSKIYIFFLADEGEANAHSFWWTCPRPNWITRTEFTLSWIPRTIEDGRLINSLQLNGLRVQSCSSLWERAAWSSPNTSQVSLDTCHVNTQSENRSWVPTVLTLPIAMNKKKRKSRKNFFLAQNKANKANKAKDANSASFADPEIFISGYFALLPNKAT